ncbi:MAG TPA: prepilin-type N-terminal cleavage/methylation domain-containing protein [Candidatus Paceibacterota bacterium]
MKRGFTIMELALVLAIIALLAFMGISALTRFRSSALLDQTHAEIVTALNEARGMTLASKEGDVYGVHFEANEIVRFKGSSYATSSPNNASTTLDARVRIESIDIVSGHDVVFQRLTGATANTGTVVVVVTSDSSRRATTSILASGIIE